MSGSLLLWQVDTFKEGSNLAVLWLVMMTYGLAVLPYSYILHFLFSVPTTGFVVLLNITFMTGEMVIMTWLEIDISATGKLTALNKIRK